jgi:hypothetical protein
VCCSSCLFWFGQEPPRFRVLHLSHLGLSPWSSFFEPSVLCLDLFSPICCYRSSYEARYLVSVVHFLFIVVSVGVGVEALTDLATSFSFTVYLRFSARRTVVFVFILLESVLFLLARSGPGLRFARLSFSARFSWQSWVRSGPVRTGSRQRPRPMVNKFGTFCRNSTDLE